MFRLFVVLSITLSRISSLVCISKKFTSEALLLVSPCSAAFSPSCPARCSNKYDEWGYWCLQNELRSERLWCLAALMTYPDETTYSHFHVAWHTVVAIELIPHSYDEVGTCFSMYVYVRACKCVLSAHIFAFSFFPLTSFERPTCLATVSAHFNQCAYLKCLKRLLSVAFVVRINYCQWHMHTHPLSPCRFSVDQHICSHSNLHAKR